MPPLARQRTLESRRSWWSDHNLPDAIFNLHAAAKPLMKFLYHQQALNFIRDKSGISPSQTTTEIYGSYLSSKYVSSFTKNAIVLDTRAAVALFKALTQHERISELCHDEVYEQVLWVLHALTQDPSPPFANAIVKAKANRTQATSACPLDFRSSIVGRVLSDGCIKTAALRRASSFPGVGWACLRAGVCIGGVIRRIPGLLPRFAFFVRGNVNFEGSARRILSSCGGAFRRPVFLEQTAGGGGVGGIGFALLFNPQNKDAGILVNHSGKMADGGASCLQSQMRSCPSGSYYDLRPAVDSEFPEDSGFPWFTLGGYMARQWDAPILRYMERGVSEPVEKIPDAILELEQFLRVLPAELFPQPQDKSEDETPEVEALLDALEGLANVERLLRQGERIQAII
ncbi:hypothetical protein C8J57DRAFT_1245076 [Mycena rebaudengoi]|nr:hypothetical protein C8J57DRAFT_1245076 [Mycena rebaudengoi]